MKLLKWPVAAFFAGAALFYLSAQSNAPFTWKSVRIVGGGYIPGLVAHPTEPGLMYARTENGGAYRWDAGAKRWIPLLDFFSAPNYNLTGPESIALDPTDPNKLYIAAGMNTASSNNPPSVFAILVSNDRGATFTVNTLTSFAMGSSNNGRSVGERLAVNPFNPSQLFMGTRQRGLWKSDDNAATWNQVTSYPTDPASAGPYGVQWVLFDTKTANTIYAGSFGLATIYRSQNDGATWSALPGMPLAWPYTVDTGTAAPSPQRAVLNPDGSLYVTFADTAGPNFSNAGSVPIKYGLVEKFDPSTNTWTNITPEFNAAAGGSYVGITQDPTQAGAGTVAVATFARTPGDTIYLTRDHGKTWTDLGRVTSAAGFAGLSGANYYFNPSVFTSIAPWLTYGNTALPATGASFGWWMSGLLIDPTNPNHMMFPTGATVYATDNLSAAFSGQSPNWYVQANGLENSTVNALISPTDGAHLLSGLNNIGGFRHDSLTVSPPAGIYTNPVATTVASLDWAGQKPSVITRTQSAITSQQSSNPCTWGAISNDGGTTWSPLPTCAAGADRTEGGQNGGSLAVDANGAMLMWTPPSNAGPASRPQYSTDGGHTWTTVAGLGGRFTAVSDKVTPQLFYAYGNGAFYNTGSTAGATFTAVNSTLPSSGTCNGGRCGFPIVNFARSGDIWLPLGSNGLYHSTDKGVTWTKLSNVGQANAIAVGAAASSGAPQSIYFYGTPTSTNALGIYRSDDNGSSWLRLDDPAHQYGGPQLIGADSRVFGRVFLGTTGRGIIYGDSEPDATPILKRNPKRK